MGALSLTGDWRRPPLEPGLPGVVRAMDCHCTACPFGKKRDSCSIECALHIADVLALEGSGSVAAVIMEAVPGANGVLIPPPAYWPMVREACDADGALLIADEVLTGFGRTGRCFAFEHFDVVPDMITVAKALTGGYGSLGAVLVHERVAAHFDDHVLVAGLTNYAHPLACAAALEALAVYEDDDLYQVADSLGTTLASELLALRKQFPTCVKAQRSIGLLGCVELCATEQQWGALLAALAADHLFVHAEPRRGTVLFAPPLVISEAMLIDGMRRFKAALTIGMGSGMGSGMGGGG